MNKALTEVKGGGPLDYIRNLSEGLENLDYALAHGDVITNIRHVEDHIDYVNSHIPYVDKLSEAKGSSFVRRSDKDKDSDFFNPILEIDNDYEYEFIGLYRGIRLLHAGDGEGGVCFRIAHVMEDLKKEIGMTHDGRKTIVVNERYLPLSDSEVTRLEPIGAHSYVDLENDDLRNDIDLIVFNDERSTLETFWKLRSFLSRLLNPQKNEVRELNHQRISYLNSLGFFTGKVATTQEMVAGEIPSYLSMAQLADIEIWKLPEPVEIMPSAVAVQEGYRITSSTEDLVFNGRTESYLRAKFDGRNVIVPMRSIIEIV